MKNREAEIYRQSPQGPLELEILRPAGPASGGAIAFFFGGGWQRGTPAHFLRQARYCAERGAFAFLVDYRVESRHGTSPLDAVEDARSALRYLKRHAARLGFDPARLAAAGGSAGGHLAFCTALAETVNAAEDDPAESSAPAAIVGFNAVCDTGRDGFGHDRFPGGKALAASPLHLVRSGMPPALLLHGTADRTVPIRQARALRNAIVGCGGSCRLVEYEGRGHGFFNEGPDFASTLAELGRFLGTYCALLIQGSLDIDVPSIR